MSRAFFLAEIEIWKQKQADYRTRLVEMSIRHAEDPESVTLHALAQMVESIRYATEQRESKESLLSQAAEKP